MESWKLSQPNNNQPNNEPTNQRTIQPPDRFGQSFSIQTMLVFERAKDQQEFNEKLLNDNKKAMCNNRPNIVVETVPIEICNTQFGQPVRVQAN